MPGPGHHLVLAGVATGFYLRLGIHHCILTIVHASCGTGTVRPASYISIKTQVTYLKVQ